MGVSVHPWSHGRVGGSGSASAASMGPRWPFLAALALQRVDVRADSSVATTDASLALPDADTGAALDKLLLDLTRDPSFAGARHAGVLALGCLQEPRAEDTEVFFLAAPLLSSKFVLYHTYAAGFCASRGIGIGSLALLVATDLHRAEDDICKGGGITMQCEQPHIELDLFQTESIPLQKLVPSKMAQAAYDWAHEHRAPLVGVATPENLLTTYSARPLVLLFATVGEFGSDAEVETFHFWQRKLAVVSHYYGNTSCTFAMADKITMADEASKFGYSREAPPFQLLIPGTFLRQNVAEHRPRRGRDGRGWDGCD